MGRRARLAFAIATLVIGTGAGARAQTTQAPRPAVLPPVPELRLSWPITPLAYRYTESEETGYQSGPLQLFRAESLWLKAPGLRLLTFTSSERAFELDCRLTCQPVTMRNLALEARWLLPTRSGAVVSEPHVFVRQSTMRTALSPRSARTLSVGLAGLLNF